MQMMELIRNGVASTTNGKELVQRDGSISSLMSLGGKLLGQNQVLPHVPSLVKEVQVEATFRDGTKLLTIHNPIGAEDGDLALALEGSFLPVPDLSVFKNNAEKEEETTMCPGQVIVSDSLGDIEINCERELIEIPVTNTGDRPIQ
jgi:urease gamma subunit